MTTEMKLTVTLSEHALVTSTDEVRVQQLEVTGRGDIIELTHCLFSILESFELICPVENFNSFAI